MGNCPKCACTPQQSGANNLQPVLNADEFVGDAVQHGEWQAPLAKSVAQEQNGGFQGSNSGKTKDPPSVLGEETFNANSVDADLAVKAVGVVGLFRSRFHADRSDEGIWVRKADGGWVRQEQLMRERTK